MTNSLPVLGNCEACCGCCRGRAVPPFTGIDDPEYLTLPEELQASLRPLLMNELPVDDEYLSCAWLDSRTGYCLHYELRPSPCREFERGSFYCQMLWRKWSLSPPSGVMKDSEETSTAESLQQIQEVEPPSLV